MSREEKIKIYDKIVANAGLPRKGKTMPYTSANGHMFSQINKDGEIGIRFSKERQKALFEALNTTVFKSYGAVMQGYVLLPEEIVNDIDKASALLKESHDYILTLEPKPTKKK